MILNHRIRLEMLQGFLKSSQDVDCDFSESENLYLSQKKSKRFLQKDQNQVLHPITDLFRYLQDMKAENARNLEGKPVEMSINMNKPTFDNLHKVKSKINDKSLSTIKNNVNDMELLYKIRQNDIVVVAMVTKRFDRILMEDFLKKCKFRTRSVSMSANGKRRGSDMPMRRQVGRSFRAVKRFAQNLLKDTKDDDKRSISLYESAMMMKNGIGVSYSDEELNYFDNYIANDCFGDDDDDRKVCMKLTRPKGKLRGLKAKYVRKIIRKLHTPGRDIALFYILREISTNTGFEQKLKALQGQEIIIEATNSNVLRGVSLGEKEFLVDIPKTNCKVDFLLFFYEFMINLRIVIYKTTKLPLKTILMNPSCVKDKIDRSILISHIWKFITLLSDNLPTNFRYSSLYVMEMYNSVLSGILQLFSLLNQLDNVHSCCVNERDINDILLLFNIHKEYLMRYEMIIDFSNKNKICKLRNLNEMSKNLPLHFKAKNDILIKKFKNILNLNNHDSNSNTNDDINSGSMSKISNDPSMVQCCDQIFEIASKKVSKQDEIMRKSSDVVGSNLGAINIDFLTHPTLKRFTNIHANNVSNDILLNNNEKSQKINHLKDLIDDKLKINSHCQSKNIFPLEMSSFLYDKQTEMNEKNVHKESMDSKNTSTIESLSKISQSSSKNNNYNFLIDLDDMEVKNSSKLVGVSSKDQELSVPSSLMTSKSNKNIFDTKTQKYHKSMDLNSKNLALSSMTNSTMTCDDILGYNDAIKTSNECDEKISKYMKDPKDKNKKKFESRKSIENVLMHPCDLSQDQWSKMLENTVIDFIFNDSVSQSDLNRVYDAFEKHKSTFSTSDKV